MALIPKQTKAQAKMYRNLTSSRFIGLILAIFGGLFFGNLVHSSIRLLFMIIVPVFYLVLTMRSPTNPKKNLAQSMADYFRYLAGRKHYRSLLGYSFEESLKEGRQLKNGEERAKNKAGKNSKAG